MRTRFYDDGHLTDEALTALILGTDADELGRLEMAEHLAFCDQCLQRYTDLLAAGTLLTPAKSCQESLWRRIRARTLHLLTSRYATAAARWLGHWKCFGRRGYLFPNPQAGIRFSAGRHSRTRRLMLAGAVERLQSGLSD